ncbi:MAG: hypothetical protein GTO55_04355 [Armatimonadetes bacterium]|nr:hypothetical protein [Armatimonadota bacterium]NIM23502.1 hypothetical protein [Armatimonadota bacterium]NIM67368.1 hypothetical protein [Armatimonadota bacterium]NIM75869.1 hypothetical protein [Armatimonadota bacterium]NIN05554.1 hypothetical protein [Armatimonadota bacterium]
MRLSILLLLAVAAILAFGSSSAPAGQPEVTEALAPSDIPEVFKKALHSSPEEYLVYREQILASGEAGADYLRKVQEKETSWLVCELAKAMLQRIEEPEEIEKLDEEFVHLASSRDLHSVFSDLSLRPRRGLSRSPGNAVEDHVSHLRDSKIAGDSLHNTAFLVEKLFKQPPQNAAIALLYVIGGKTAAQAVAVYLQTQDAPDKILDAAELPHEQQFDQMISFLKHSGNKSLAAWVLGEFGDPEAVPQLVYALGRDLSVRQPFIRQALVKIGEPAIPALLEVLLSPECVRVSSFPVTRASVARYVLLNGAAASALSEMGPVAIPALGEALERGADIPQCHYHTVRALRWIATPEVVPLLIKALKSPDKSARGEAGHALGEIPDERARAALLEALADSENYHQSTIFGITEGLGKLKEKRAIPPLCELALHSDWLIRRAAIQGLGLIDDSAALPVLIQCLEHDNVATRGDAVFALGQIGDPAAVPHLLQTLQDKERFVASWSAWSLAEIKAVSAIPDLIAALKHADADVRRVTADSLKKLTGQDLGQSYDAWQEWWEKNKSDQPDATEIPAPSNIPEIFKKALHSSPEEYLVYRDQIVAAGEAGADYLRKAQEEETSWLVRELATAMLQRIEEPREIEKLDEEFARLALQDWHKQFADKRNYERTLDELSKKKIAEDCPRNKAFLVEKLFKQPAWSFRDSVPYRLPPRKFPKHGSRAGSVKSAQYSSAVGGGRMGSGSVTRLFNPQNAAIALLYVTGGKFAAQAVAVYLQADGASDKMIDAAELPREEQLAHMVSFLKDSEKKGLAAWVLSEFGDPELAPYLADALEKDDSVLPLFPQKALIVAGEPAIPALLEALLTPVFELQRAAGDVLYKMGSVAIPALGEAMERGAPNCHRHTVLALGRIATPEVVPLLLKALRSPDKSARGIAGHSLGEILGEGAGPPLLEALADPENHHHSTIFGIVKGLVAIKEKRAIPPLCELALHSDWLVRRAAIQGLGLIGDSAALPVLIQCLEHDNVATRGDAVFALGQIGDPAAVPHLLQTLQDKERFVASWSAWSLAEIKAVSAIPDLIAALKHADADVRRVTADSLKKLTGQDLGQSYDAWQEWWEKSKSE